MKLLPALLAAGLLLASCYKVKDDLMEDKALRLLDGTEWQVTVYANGRQNNSADFSSFLFRFRRDLTVLALRNAVPVAIGTWQGNIPNKTIAAHFSDTLHPLPLLNATWAIVESTPNSLNATSVQNGDTCHLQMERR